MKWKLAISIQFVSYWTNGQRKSPPTSPVRVKSFFFLLTKPLGVEKSSVFFCHCFCLRLLSHRWRMLEIVWRFICVWRTRQPPVNCVRTFRRDICAVHLMRSECDRDGPSGMAKYVYDCILWSKNRCTIGLSSACISYFMWFGRLMINMAQ